MAASWNGEGQGEQDDGDVAQLDHPCTFVEPRLLSPSSNHSSLSRVNREQTMIGRPNLSKKWSVYVLKQTLPNGISNPMSSVVGRVEDASENNVSGERKPDDTGNQSREQSHAPSLLLAEYSSNPFLTILAKSRKRRIVFLLFSLSFFSFLSVCVTWRIRPSGKTSVRGRKSHVCY